MKIILALTFIMGIAASACQSQGRLEEVDAKTFQQQIRTTKDALVLDVRTPREYQGGHIPGAINIDFYEDDFKTRLEKLDKNKTCFVYCHAGGRSQSAAMMMKKAGFLHVVELEDGMQDWRNHKLPEEKE